MTSQHWKDENDRFTPTCQPGNFLHPCGPHFQVKPSLLKSSHTEGNYIRMWWQWSAVSAAFISPDCYLLTHYVNTLKLLYSVMTQKDIMILSQIVSSANPTSAITEAMGYWYHTGWGWVKHLKLLVSWPRTTSVLSQVHQSQLVSNEDNAWLHIP